MPVHFSPAEMSARRQAAAAALRAQGIDALLMFRQESMYYLTGYETFANTFLAAVALVCVLFWLN